MSASLPLALLLALTITSTTLADDRKCYTPDAVDRNVETNSTNYAPCNPNTDVVSMCCATNNEGQDNCNPQGPVSVLNGLCYNHVDNVYWRESCTDVRIPHALNYLPLLGLNSIYFADQTCRVANLAEPQLHQAVRERHRLQWFVIRDM